MTLTRAGGLWATLPFALALAAVRLSAPWIRDRLPLATHALTSFGGGVAATYVFPYLLPRLSEGNQAVAEVLEDAVAPNPVAGLVMSEHFPVGLTGQWRGVLAGGALAGWLVAVVAPPTSTLLVNVITAFLGGAILLNVFVHELPPDRHSSFGWFVTGLAVYAVLLAAATVTSKIGAA